MVNWLNYAPSSGYGNGRITITAQTLSGLDDRMATFIAKNTEYNLSASTVVNQSWSSYIGNYLTFNILTGGTLYWKGSDTGKTISYSKDSGTTWTDITATTAGAPINVSSGDIVMFKGDNSTYGYNSFGDLDAKYEIEGNIYSIVDSDNFAALDPDDIFFPGLFEGCTGLTSAANLVLPSKNLFKNFSNFDCYDSMFKGCTSLVSAPSVLPATALTESCYHEMFANCTSLLNPPRLPANNLTCGYGNKCYSAMFYGCTSLVTAPALPATVLSLDCYMEMFEGCTSLVNAPALPATVLNGYCYFNMFRGCTSLETAPELLVIYNTGSGDACSGMFYGCTSLNYLKCMAFYDYYGFSNWVTNVPSGGTFVQNDINIDPYYGETYWPTGNNGIPSGWTIETVHYINKSLEFNCYTPNSDWPYGYKIGFSGLGGTNYINILDCVGSTSGNIANGLRSGDTFSINVQNLTQDSKYISIKYSDTSPDPSFYRIGKNQFAWASNLQFDPNKKLYIVISNTSS